MEESPSTPILEGRGLLRTYRLGAVAVPALRGVDLAVAPSDFVVLRGPSGSGKTTLINLLGLLDRPDGGGVWLDGRSVAALDDDQLSDCRRDRFGFVFQTFNLVPVLTAAENVEYPMVLRHAPAALRRRRSRELLSRVGLEGKADVRPDLLSGGDRHALANDPEVVLADEPTASLDTRGAEGVLDLMQRLHEDRAVALVVSTHDPRVAGRARRVVTLVDGRVESST